MLNVSESVAPPTVIDYADPTVKTAMASGRMNTDESTILANVSASIRRGHTQWRGGPVRPDRICLVGSGPSLAETDGELRQLIWEGAQLVTLNGAYHWAIDHGFKPNTQIVMDARASNARFVEPAVPKCNYVLASQCAPSVWDAVEGRPHVWIFHPVVKQEGPVSELLDTYYAGQWVGIGGGTTVATRAIGLLRTAGYLRFDLFGIDCCRFGEAHHALPQPENDGDRYVTVTLSEADRPETVRTFTVAHWHLKQFEDLLTIMKVNGQHFTLTAHGDGMFSYALRILGSGEIAMSTSEEHT